MRDPQSTWTAPDEPKTWLRVAHQQAISILRESERQSDDFRKQIAGLSEAIGKIDKEQPK